MFKLCVNVFKVLNRPQIYTVVVDIYLLWFLVMSVGSYRR